MSDVGEDYRAWDMRKKEVKAKNRAESIERLNTSMIQFYSKNNGEHLILNGVEGVIDFWPSTGRWVDRKTKRNGYDARGLFSFMGLGGFEK